MDLYIDRCRNRTDIAKPIRRRTPAVAGGRARSTGRPLWRRRPACSGSRAIEATSIADLTEAMGIGSPSLYAAFGSKEALYAEALRHYRENYEALVWARFFSAGTAREAVEFLLMDSAAALTGCLVRHSPRLHGGALVGRQRGPCGTRRTGAIGARRYARSLEGAPGQAVAEGEIPASVDVHALARFVQTVQSGMSILARDGAGRAELEAVAQVAMLGWDARIRALNSA